MATASAPPNARRPAWLLLLGVALAVALGLALIPDLRARLASALGVRWGETTPAQPPQVSATTSSPQIRLVAGRPNAIQVPEAVVEALGIRTVPTRLPTRPQELELIGTLAIDPDRLAHVHTRFTGEVVELGTVEEPGGQDDDGPPARRPIRYGDHVESGQLLAVLWSTELGEKKSEYVDALSKLRLERDTLARQETLYRSEATPERNVREARRNVEAAEIAVARAERTLRAIRLSEDEIAAIRAEAEMLNGDRSTRENTVERDWARVELRAPLTGTILEKNLTVGDIVETTNDLFKVADLSQLAVWAHVYEDDLPTLLALPGPIPWKVRLKSEPEQPLASSRIDRIGNIIDPIQHTAPVMGRVANPDARLRAGEFIVATIDIPPPSNVVEIPIDALVEDGHQSIVFVQPDRSRPEFVLRPVDVVKRFEDRAYLRGRPRSPGAPEEPAAPQVGDAVVVSGAIELWAAVSRLQAENAAASPGASAPPPGVAPLNSPER
jgi:cobalt-zinc-cadmium efflux system membrane fusion protein